MNLLIGCKVKAKEGKYPEGVIFFAQAGQAQDKWAILRVWFMDKKGCVHAKWFKDIDLAEDDIKRINKIGNSQKMKNEILVNNLSRFDLMDLK